VGLLRIKKSQFEINTDFVVLQHFSQDEAMRNVLCTQFIIPPNVIAVQKDLHENFPGRKKTCFYEDVSSVGAELIR